MNQTVAHKEDMRILVVDDDPGIRHLIWSVLRRHGFSVAVAHNPADARRRMQEEQFRILITDHDMPQENGLTFVKKLRAGSETDSHHRHIPVVMVSARSGAEYVEAVEQAGIQALVQKPFLPTPFARLMRQIADASEPIEFICMQTLN